MKVLLVDHEDSFVHNIEQALASDGATVTCLRSTVPLQEAVKLDPDAVVLSPGPGHPGDRRLGDGALGEAMGTKIDAANLGEHLRRVKP